VTRYRHLLRSVVAVVAFAGTGSAGARGGEGASAPRDTISLRVGQSSDYTPGFLPAQVVCDDLSVIRVEDAGSHFRITGLRAGGTDCSFWSIALKGIRRFVHITVSER